MPRWTDGVEHFGNVGALFEVHVPKAARHPARDRLLHPSERSHFLAGPPATARQQHCRLHHLDQVASARGNLQGVMKWLDSCTDLSSRAGGEHNLGRNKYLN